MRRLLPRWRMRKRKISRFEVYREINLKRNIFLSKFLK